jgi:hypothetical protein
MCGKEEFGSKSIGSGLSIFRRGVGGLVFLEASLAAKVKRLIPLGKGEGLALGNVTPADGVLNHLLGYFIGSGRAPALGEKSSFHCPVKNPQ